jgi:hypothetical protein
MLRHHECNKKARLGWAYSSLAKKELQQLWQRKCHDEKNQLQ